MPSKAGQGGRRKDESAGAGQASHGWYAVNAVEAPAEKRAEVTRRHSTDDLPGLPPLDSAEEPRIDVEVDGAGGELSLAQFFRPAMWGLAWIPILLTALLSYSFVIRAGDNVSVWPYREPAYIDAYGHSAPIGLIGRHLLPSGIPQLVSTAFGQDQSVVMIQGDMLMGIASLLVGFMIVIMITRRSNDAIYACGPYAVYSVASVLVLTLNGPLFDGLAGIFPALLGALVLPLLVATGAKIFAIAMRNGGVFDIDQDVPAYEDMEYAVKAEGIGKPSAAGAGGSSEAAPLPTSTPIEFAQVCPFCGNPNIQHDHPKQCTACHKNLGLAFEVRGAAPCSDCGGALVREAVFCHHCGKWQKGELTTAVEESPRQGAA